ncbi:MAG: translation initiation factor eIF-2B [Erysipelotrichaceae bacterium]|nr:translation initiation factor eIF-2B [Erysipelotrichaceae bacterium]MBR3226911.1 translation initiation factor eIF-2B [Erysipelotrichaceae bacterium]
MKERVKDIDFKSADHVIQEIRDMNVKGGSPFGRSAAWAFKLATEKEELKTKAKLHARYKDLTKQMIALKPTMATIRNTCNIVEEVYEENKDLALEDLKKKVVHVCENIIENSFSSVDRLAEIGANRIKDGDVIMMHSYSSTLMAIFIKASEQGKKFTVICTESRPLRESRNAVKYLQEWDQKVIYITDAEAFEFMPMADFIIAGADSLCCDGSIANKIGTATLAALAKLCKKPVYIASELYKYNPLTKEGYPIELERRTENEIISKGDFKSHKNLEVINQFFDLTPACNITGLICEFGLINSSNIDMYWNELVKKVKE